VSKKSEERDGSLSWNRLVESDVGLVLSLSEVNGTLEDRANLSGAGVGIVVVTTNAARVLANVVAVEAHVLVGEISVGANDLAVHVGNALVVGDAVVGTRAADVLVEALEVGAHLLDDNSLELDVTDLAGDDALHELADDGQLLLDDGDLDAAADQLLFLLNDDLLVGTSVEVVRAIEVVEVAKAAVKAVVLSADSGDGPGDEGKGAEIAADGCGKSSGGKGKSRENERSSNHSE